MNAQNAKELLPLIQALADRKTIQEDISGQWCDTEVPTFFREVCFYRIKPEPRTFEMYLTSSGSMYPASQRNAEYLATCERITVREVLK